MSVIERGKEGERENGCACVVMWVCEFVRESERNKREERVRDERNFMHE